MTGSNNESCALGKYKIIAWYGSHQTHHLASTPIAVALLALWLGGTVLLSMLHL